MHYSTRWTRLVAVALVAVMTFSCDDDDPSESEPEIFDATLNGANERPTPVVTAATGTATLTFNGNNIGYVINVTGISGAATMAHIHGPADAEEVADPIVTFSGLTTVTTGVLGQGSFSATGVAAVSMDSLRTLIRNGNAYINVHTAANTGGEIRGQLVVRP